MTEQEKAKAFDEALERFHQFKEKYYSKKTHFGDVLFDKTGEMQKDFDSIFPQLAESEDEKIRKKLIEIVGYFRSRGIDQQLCEKFLAYLEKQKEPVPIPDKFSGLKSLMLQYLQSAANRKDDAEIEDDTDLWGRKILDYVWMQDGKQKEQKPAEKQDYSGLNDLERAIHRGFLAAGVENVPVGIIKETAKECLAQMNPAEWSEKDSMLEKCLQEIENATWEIRYRLKYLSPQPKQEWDEEDKKTMQDLIDLLWIMQGSTNLIPGTASKYTNWLKSLPERFNLQPKQEWNTNDKAMVNCIVCCLDGQFVPEAARKQSLEWFNKHRRDFLNQPKQEWSEEDEKMLELVIANYEYMFDKLRKGDDSDGIPDHILIMDWLKSLPLNLKKKNDDVAKLCSNEWSEEDERIAKEIEEELWYPGDFPDYPSKEESELYDDCQRRLDWFKNKLKSLRPSWKPSVEDIKMLKHIIGQYETGNKNSKVMGYLPRVEELDFLKKVLAKWKN